MFIDGNLRVDAAENTLTCIAVLNERQKTSRLWAMNSNRKKTTIYVDPELLRAAKVLAASTGRHEYEVHEEALRRYLRDAAVSTSRDALRDLLDQVAPRADLDDEEALHLANAELHEARRARLPG